VDVVLVAVGVVLVALGAVVLLRFPDRPGGTVKLLGLEVNSVGAGLPLVALGLAAVAAVVVGPLGDAASTDADDDGGGGGSGGVAGPPPAGAPACLATWFDEAPAVTVARRRALPAERDDVDVLGADEAKAEEFGLVLTDRGDVVGALKMTFDVDANQFGIDGAVDGDCAPTTWRADGRPGPDPDLVNTSEMLRLALAGRDYSIELKDTQPEIEVELHRTAR
jgi:hypothetical protein